MHINIKSQNVFFCVVSVHIFTVYLRVYKAVFFLHIFKYSDIFSLTVIAINMLGIISVSLCINIHNTCIIFRYTPESRSLYISLIPRLSIRSLRTSLLFQNKYPGLLYMFIKTSVNISIYCLTC